jgi:hypothetical protein
MIMANTFKLAWDEETKKLYETGVDRGVVYPKTGDKGAYAAGEAWNGLVNVTESPEGAEATPLYANNHKYLNIMSNEDFNGSIEAYTYPDGFAACLGQKELVPGVYVTQQERKAFGFSYRTLIGNDTEGNNYGYKIHIVYDAMAGVSEKSNQTTGEENEPETMSWDFTTTPVEVGTGFKPTAHIVINSTDFADEAGKAKLAALEAKLYGSGETEASLPTPAELKTILAAEEE